MVDYIGLTPDEYWQANVANRQGLEQTQADAEQATGGAPAQLDPRQALETYRNLKGQGYDDGQIKQAFDRHGWAMPPTGVFSELGRGLERGAYSSAGAGIEGIGAAVGSPGMVSYGQGLAKQAEDPSLVPGVQDYNEIGKYGGGITRAADDVMRYGANLIGTTIPESAGIAGAGLAAAAAAPEGAAAVAAGGIAAFGTSLFPNLGRNVQEQVDRGAAPEDVMIGGDGFARAGAAAIGQSALDSFLSTRISGLVKGGFARASSPNMIRRILKEAIIGAPIEASTEAAQEALQILQADPHLSALVTPEGKQRLISNAIGGALVGGLLEGAAGILPEHEHPAPPPPPRPGLDGPPPPAPVFTEGSSTVGPIVPPPGAGTPLGGVNRDRVGAQANRAAGDLFTNIRGPIGPDTPPGGPRMADLAQGTRDVGILGRALGLDALLPQDSSQAPAGIEQGMALHAATTAAMGDAPVQGPGTAEILEQADQINERARIEREQAAERARREREAFDQAHPVVPEPGAPGAASVAPVAPAPEAPVGAGEAPGSPTPAPPLSPDQTGMQEAPAAPPGAPLAGPGPLPPSAGTAPPAVPTPPEAAPPAAFSATHLDTATNQPVQLADDGKVRTVRYADGTVRHERAGKNAQRYTPLPPQGDAGAVLSPPVQNRPADDVGLAGGPGPGATVPPAPASLPEGGPIKPPVPAQPKPAETQPEAVKPQPPAPGTQPSGAETQPPPRGTHHALSSQRAKWEAAEAKLPPGYTLHPKAEGGHVVVDLRHPDGTKTAPWRSMSMDDQIIAATAAAKRHAEKGAAPSTKAEAGKPVTPVTELAAPEKGAAPSTPPVATTGGVTDKAEPKLPGLLEKHPLGWKGSQKPGSVSADRYDADLGDGERAAIKFVAGSWQAQIIDAKNSVKAHQPVDSSVHGKGIKSSLDWLDAQLKKAKPSEEVGKPGPRNEAGTDLTRKDYVAKGDEYVHPDHPHQRFKVTAVYASDSEGEVNAAVDWLNPPPHLAGDESVTKDHLSGVDEIERFTGKTVDPRLVAEASSAAEVKRGTPAGAKDLAQAQRLRAKAREGRAANRLKPPYVYPVVPADKPVNVIEFGRQLRASDGHVSSVNATSADGSMYALYHQGDDNWKVRVARPDRRTVDTLEAPAGETWDKEEANRAAVRDAFRPDPAAVAAANARSAEVVARHKALLDGTAPPVEWPELLSLDAMLRQEGDPTSVDAGVPPDLREEALGLIREARRRLGAMGYRDVGEVNGATARTFGPAAEIKQAMSRLGGGLSRLAKRMNANIKGYKGHLAASDEQVQAELDETRADVAKLRQAVAMPPGSSAHPDFPGPGTPAVPETPPEPPPQAEPSATAAAGPAPAERKWRVGDKVRITKGDNEGKFATLTHAERMVFTPALPGPRGFVAMPNMPGSESWMLRGRIEGGPDREEFLHEGSLERVHRTEHRKIGDQGFDQLDVDTLAPDFAKELDRRDEHLADGNRRQAGKIQQALEDRLQRIEDRWGPEAAEETKAEAERISEATWELPPKKGAKAPADDGKPYRVRYSGPVGVEPQVESFDTLEEAYARNREPMPDGYTMGTVEERQGKRWKFVASSEKKPEAAQPVKRPGETGPETEASAPTPAPAAGNFGTIDQPNRMEAASALASHLDKGDGFAGITDARKLVARMYGLDSIKPGTPEAKTVDELVELAGVVAARNVAQGNPEPETTTFDIIAKIADRLPNLGTRTSTSVVQQAYSTPLPIAFVASRFADVAHLPSLPANRIYEPTAGQGALLIEADGKATTRANELNPDRADALEAQGFTVNREDATSHNPAGVAGPGYAAPVPNFAFDRVIANPPFGTVKGEDGKSKRWPIAWKGKDLFDTGEVDQAIAWQALAQMKPGGRAVLILGAPNEKIQDRAKGYISGAKQKFYLALYRHYNVTGHYTLSGDLYAKQGAQWPVDMIVVNGQGESALPLPAKQAPRFIANLDELKGLLADVAATHGGPRGAATEGAAGGGAGVGAGQAGGRPQGLADLPGAAGGPGPVADQGEPGQRPAAGGEAVSGGPPAVGGERPGGVSGGAPEPAGARPPGEPGAGPAAAPAQGPGAGAGAAPGNAPGGVGGRAGGIDGELEGLSAADIDALIDAGLDEIGVGSAPPPPKDVKAAPRKPKAPPAKVWALFGHDKPKATVQQLRAQVAAIERQIKALMDAIPITRDGTPEERARYAELERRRVALQDQIDAAEKPQPPKQAPPKSPPDRNRAPKAKPETKPKEKTAGEELKTAVAKSAEAADQAFSAIFKLTGGGSSTLGSGFIYNEETWQAALPHFKAAWKAAREAGEALRQFVVKMLKLAADAPAEWVRTVWKPMLSRFMQELQAGKIKLEDDVPEPPPPPAASELQVVYSPRSTGTRAVGTLIPVNMHQVSLEAFEAFERKNGPVDAYVAKKLGYAEKDLGKYFSGEQVDALALAIQTIDDGTGFIIGDQTGVGKGRVNAAVMKYAIKNGLTPIFVTEKPNLYADMIRDVSDIGMPGFVPFVTNSNLSGSDAIELPDGRLLTTSKEHKLELAHAQSAGKLVDRTGKKYDAIFTTYNQLQEIGKGKTPRHSFVERFLPKGVLILDESHNAGGAGPKEEKSSKKPQGTPRSEIIRQYVGMARSAFYSSATYAKRPDSMSLYFKTDIRLAISDLQKIDKVFAKGGVPLQQIMSAMLTKAGQYLRRERSFEGVEFQPKPFPVNPEFAGRAAEGMRTIVKFEDEVIKPIIAGIIEDTAGEGSAAGGDASQINSTNFTALMHNVIDQMLLCLKADATADEAIAALERGEKPVIAVANTMGAMIEELVKESGITPGQRLDFSFKDVMLRYLDRTRWYTEGSGYGEKVRTYITDEELGPEGLRRFKAAQNTIRRLDFGGLPGSPIDHITNRITQAGYRVGEITGRSHIIDYSNADLGPIYRTRSGAEKSKGAVVKNIKRFNGGDKANPIPIQDRLDAFILNQSGATGLSLHASEKFGDQRRRRMIIAQAERNIDTFMQMLGRVHRTGQVIPPAYTLAVADIPAEKRPAAVLLKKMASLNANTTASAESSLDVGDLPDFINENGDETAAAVLNDDIELWNELGRPLKFSQKASVEGFDPQDAMKKVTGRIPLLPVERQEEVYQTLEEAYADLIARKKAMGENVGGAESQDLDAKTLQATTVFEGVGSSPFSQPAKLEKVDVKRQGKPHTSEEVVAMVEEGTKKQPDMRQVEQDFDAYLEQHMDKFVSPVGATTAAAGMKVDPDKDQEREKRERDRLQGTMDRLRLTTRDLHVGGTVRILDPESGEAFYGVTVGLEHKGKAKNPAANGGWRYTFAVADPMRRLTMPVSRFLTPSTMPAKIPGGMLVVTPHPEGERIDLMLDGNPRTVWQLFDELQAGSREQRYMVTGNVFAGFNHFNGKGQIVFYTDHDGTNRQGVLMPRSFKGAEELAKAPQELKTAEAVMKFFEKVPNAQVMTSDQGLILATLDGGRSHALITAKSKAKGGRYFTSKPLTEAIGKDFVSSGQNMVAKDLTGAEVRAAIKVIQENFGALYAFSDQTTARKIQGIAEPKLSDQTKDEGEDDVQASAPPQERFGVLSQPLSPKAAKQRASLIHAATLLARQMNPRVAVEFAERLFAGGKSLEESSGRAEGGRIREVAGLYYRNRDLIKVALDQSGEHVLKTIAHEAWHSIETLLTPQEQAILNEAYPPQGRRSQAEEIAHAFEDWLGDKFSPRHKPQAKSIFARALRFIKALGQMLRGRGFRTVDDVFEAAGAIFEAAEQGEIGKRGATFKEWFGASKVVDAQGKPLRVYHATGGDFREFRDKYLGARTGANSAKVGTFFTSSTDVANTYAVDATTSDPGLKFENLGVLGKALEALDRVGMGLYVFMTTNPFAGKTEIPDETPNIRPSYLRIESPVEEDFGNLNVLELEGKWSRMIREAKASGHDGFIARNVVDPGFSDDADKHAGDVYVAFHASQIRSAFDPGQPETTTLWSAEAARGETVQARTRPATMPAYVADPRSSWADSTVDTARSVVLDKDARHKAWLKFRHDVQDRLVAVDDLELRWARGQGLPNHLLNARESAAKLSKMASDDSGRMAVAMEHAPLRWDAHAGIAKPHATIGGLKWVAESLKTPADYADATAFVYATRAAQLITEGRERLMSPADIADGLARGTPAARQFKERWEQFNGAMLQYAVDTGVLSPEQKAAYQENFYVPFYRQYEATGELMSPEELRRGLNNPSLRIHRLEGGESKLGDLFDNIVKNTAVIASAGVRNVAHQRIYKLLKDLGETTDVPHWQTPKGDDVVSFYREGKRQWHRPEDDLMFSTLAGMRPETLNGIVRGLNKFARIYRKGVTATPPFMLRNWVKGIVGTWIQTGRNVSLTANSFTEMRAFAKGDPIVAGIQAATGFGAYGFGESGGMTGKHLRKQSFEKKTLLGRVTNFWEAWEKVGEATEMADRMALAKNLMKAGVGEAEAVYQAMNVMPYSTHGAAPWVRFLTLTIPFANARIQGLARMLDTTSNVDARGRLAKRLILRGLLLTGMTAALWALNNSDEDKKRKYDAMTPDQRLMYWPLIFGDHMVLLPKPFEFGHVFATSMELGLDAMTKDQGPHDAAVVGLGALQQTFGFDTYIPMPQALVPAIEVLTNWDFFRQRAIENLGVSKLPPEQRTGPNVSFVAEALAKMIPGNVSPLQVEHLINGYFGIGGKVATASVDAVAGNLGLMPERPSGVFGSGIAGGMASVLGLDALVRNADVPSWDRWVEDFYQTKRLADEQYSGARSYALQGQIDDARDLIKGNPTLFKLRPVFNAAEVQLSKVSQAMRQIRAGDLPADEKRRRLDNLVRARNQVAETVMRTYNRIQAGGGAAQRSAA